MIASELAEAKAIFAATAKPVRIFKELDYRTGDSWSRSRRVVAKAEHLEKGSNPRFIVTSLPREQIGMIERGLAMQVDGDLTGDCAPKGVLCRSDAPLAPIAKADVRGEALRSAGRSGGSVELKGQSRHARRTARAAQIQPRAAS
jgi:Transposase DDE domain group 1